jgi:putative DNA primase/helicase
MLAHSEYRSGESQLPTVLAQLRKVQKCGSGFVACCPAHDDRNPSLSVRIGSSGCLLFKCFAGCSLESIRSAIGLALHPTFASGAPAQVAAPREVGVEHRIALSRRIWREAAPATGTAAEKYLRARGITIAIPRSIRFGTTWHPGGVYRAAMIGAVQNVAGAIVGIHRTFIKTDGSGKAAVKPNKAMLGRCAGGAVRLGPIAATVVVTEGIETALAVAQSVPEMAVWASLSTSGMRTLLLPEAVRQVVIAADGDPAGEAAAQAAAVRFIERGKIVRLARAPEGLDFADVLNGSGEGHDSANA